MLTHLIGKYEALYKNRKQNTDDRISLLDSQENSECDQLTQETINESTQSNNNNISAKKLQWSSLIATDILENLSFEERRRQQIIFEIFQTEQRHVKVLKLLETFFKPALQESGCLNADLLLMLFPHSISTLHDLHFRFEILMRERYVDCEYYVEEVGDILIKMFQGFAGKELKQEVTRICWFQQKALQEFEVEVTSNQHLQTILANLETNDLCRNLRLEHLLPTIWQRFTKYPLLFEKLYKSTIIVLPNNKTEIEAVKEALNATKDILDHVNQSLIDAETDEKLQKIYNNLIVKDSANNNYKTINFTKNQLIIDGKFLLPRLENLMFHALLYEDKLVLLQIKEDKYILRDHVFNDSANNRVLSPIIEKLAHVNQNASDRSSFFLIYENVDNSLELLEIKTASQTECESWCKFIRNSQIYSSSLTSK